MRFILPLILVMFVAPAVAYPVAGAAALGYQTDGGLSLEYSAPQSTPETGAWQYHQFRAQFTGDISVEFGDCSARIEHSPGQTFNLPAQGSYLSDGSYACLVDASIGQDFAISGPVVAWFDVTFSFNCDNCDATFTSDYQAWTSTTEHGWVAGGSKSFHKTPGCQGVTCLFAVKLN